MKLVISNQIVHLNSNLCPKFSVPISRKMLAELETIEHILDAIERGYYCRDSLKLRQLLMDISPKLRDVQSQMSDLISETEFLRQETLRALPYLPDDFD